MLDRVFVYGTLQTGGCYHHLVAPFVREVAPGSILGSLLDLGAYPGWVAGEGEVFGQVLRVDPVNEALKLLDELEDYRGPGNTENLYHRVLVEVSTADGPRAAWGYQYAGPLRGFAVIPGGRWRPF